VCTGVRRRTPTAKMITPSSRDETREGDAMPIEQKEENNS